MQRLVRRSLMLLLSIPSAGFAASLSLPPWLNLGPGMTVKEVLADERYGEARIPAPQNPQQVIRGRRWEATLKVNGVSAETPGKAVFERWKPALTQGGWVVAEERTSNPYSVSLKMTQGRQGWANVTIFGGDDIRLDLVEAGENRLRLKLPPPATKPEAMKADSSPFPFLPPPPGSKFTNADQNDKPMLILLREKDTEIRSQVAAGSIAKYYQPPRDLSNLDFALAYRDALLAAGWTLPHYSQGINAGDTLMVAHYGIGGRDIWAVLRHAPGEASIEVGDAGRSDLAQALKKDCRITLVGALFDFDKATLKPESNTVLARVQAAIAANLGLALEVEGHTDAVGNESYNQKLSEARAQSVMTWLTSNGTPAARLTARGYGKSRPVATNDTDQGRALNRRVELACRK